MNAEKDDLELPHPLNRVLGGWVCLVDDTRRLARLIAALPDQCECGEGGLPCACCANAATRFSEGCPTCAARLAALTPRLDEVVDDTLRYLPAASETVGRFNGPRTHVEEVRVRGADLERVMNLVRMSTDGFCHGCDRSDIALVKRTMEALRVCVERTHAELRALPAL
jgi:hypothetical protein